MHRLIAWTIDVNVLVDPRYPVEREPVVLTVLTTVLGEFDVPAIDVINGGELPTIRTNYRHVLANLLCFIQLRSPFGDLPDVPVYS